ncbi:hypothetical protein L208DRAFT_1380986 [Tricholoma matsutake]|nr:hypothetical protein L208DRAFT_1380986 [Tricholoma matsutake 945]
MNPPQIISTVVPIPQVSPDGGLNPHFYITHKEIQRALDAAKLSPSSINPQEHAQVLVPTLPVVPAKIIPVPVGVTAAPSSLALTGHLVSVTMVFTAADKSYGGRVAKVVMKKNQYSPGVNMGPGFKFAWTGSP